MYLEVNDHVCKRNLYGLLFWIVLKSSNFLWLYTERICAYGASRNQLYSVFLLPIQNCFMRLVIFGSMVTFMVVLVSLVLFQEFKYPYLLIIKTLKLIYGQQSLFTPPLLHLFRCEACSEKECVVIISVFSIILLSIDLTNSPTFLSSAVRGVGRS